jgi:anaerobic ribonucleoside-triphosphate reductase activating protein
MNFKQVIMMLLYASAGISELEIPNKKSLVIYISECSNNCEGCHTPYLHYKYGDELKENFEILFQVYKNYFDILCILGEGKETIEDKEEIKYYCEYAHLNNKEFCLYSGRVCDIEEWMINFDYVKLGSYKNEYGPLTSKSTNQRLLKRNFNSFEDITYLFW